MLIDLSCPAEVFRSTLPADGTPAVGLILYNLSDRVIASCEVTVRLLSGSGAEKERITYQGQALNGRPHSTFVMNVPCSPASDNKEGERKGSSPSSISRAETTVDRVVFADGEIWKRDAAASTEYTSNALPISRALSDLKFVAGEQAIGFPERQGDLWLCVCGRPNPWKDGFCARCRQERDAVFTRYSREAVETAVAQRERQLELSSRSVMEDTARLQRIREEEYRILQGRRSRRLRIAVSLALALALTAAAMGVLSPALRLTAAKEAMARERYDDAQVLLDTLGGYPGAGEARTENRWRQAAQTAAVSDSTDELAEASAALRQGNTAESLRLADAADLRRGRLLLEAGDPDGAMEALAAVPADDAERAALEADCRFAFANAALADGNYDAAREAFLALGSYPQAAALAAECVYLPASEALNAGRWDEAISLFARIPDYRDSRQQTLICHYRKAGELEDAGDPTAAAAEYLLAGDYEDAAEKNRALTYSLAEAALTAGDMTNAQQLYASVPGYSDADEKNSMCLFTMAARSYDDLEYLRALDLLRAMPQEYDDSAQLHRKAAYQAGRNALDGRDYESAVLLLEEAGGYRDAADRLGEAVEKLAEIRLDEGDADAALALIERIPGRRSYAELKKRAQEMYAVVDPETGTPEGETP